MVEQVARRLLRDAFGSPSERTVALAPPLTLALFVAWILGRASRPSGPSTSGSSCPCQNNRFSGMQISLECRSAWNAWIYHALCCQCFILIKRSVVSKLPGYGRMVMVSFHAIMLELETSSCQPHHEVVGK